MSSTEHLRQRESLVHLYSEHEEVRYDTFDDGGFKSRWRFVEICLESVSWQRSGDPDVMDRAIPSRERVFPNTWNGRSIWHGAGAPCQNPRNIESFIKRFLIYIPLEFYLIM